MRRWHLPNIEWPTMDISFYFSFLLFGFVVFFFCWKIDEPSSHTTSTLSFSLFCVSFFLSLYLKKEIGELMDIHRIWISFKRSHRIYEKRFVFSFCLSWDEKRSNNRFFYRKFASLSLSVVEMHKTTKKIKIQTYTHSSHVDNV